MIMESATQAAKSASNLASMIEAQSRMISTLAQRIDKLEAKAVTTADGADHVVCATVTIKPKVTFVGDGNSDAIGESKPELHISVDSGKYDANMSNTIVNDVMCSVSGVGSEYLREAAQRFDDVQTPAPSSVVEESKSSVSTADRLRLEALQRRLSDISHGMAPRPCGENYTAYAGSRVLWLSPRVDMWTRTLVFRNVKGWAVSARYRPGGVSTMVGFEAVNLRKGYEEETERVFIDLRSIPEQYFKPENYFELEFERFDDQSDGMRVTYPLKVSPTEDGNLKLSDALMTIASQLLGFDKPIECE